MVGVLVIGETFRNTHIRFRNIDDYETHNNSVDDGYDSTDAIFKGYIYILDRPEINRVSRSQYGNGCGFKHQIIEYRGNKLFQSNKSGRFH